MTRKEYKKGMGEYPLVREYVESKLAPNWRGLLRVVKTRKHLEYFDQDTKSWEYLILEDPEVRTVVI